MEIKTHLSIENLEKEYWGEPNYDSYLVKRCYELRKKPIKDFSIEDLRLMIGQNIGLKYIMPLALKELKLNILVEGDLYQGDLLFNVIGKNTKQYWKVNINDWLDLVKIIHQNENKFSQRDFDKILNKIQFIES